LRSDSRVFRFFCLARPTITAILVVSLWILPTSARQTVIDLHGSGVDALTRGQGKVLVLIFVRTDCPISNRYAPLLQEMEKKYGKEAAFRLVFPDRNESPEKIRQYLREYGYELVAIRDVDHALVRKTLAKVTPEAAVFDSRGQLVYHGRIDNLYEHIGQSRRAATRHELADAIEAAGKGLRPPASTADAVGCFISDLE
jgi:thiol-disulfide isomerase/thioredoxin